MVRFTVLGSGSSGNCAVISTGRTTLLLDAGLSAKQICLRMQEAGYDPEGLDGILITHEHQDHTRGLAVFGAKRRVPLLCTALTREVLERDAGLRVAPPWQVMQTGSRFAFGDLWVESFPVPHDAVDPVGYVIEDAESRLGVLSDVGYVTNLIRDRLTGADSLFIEANYCQHLLEADVKRPWATKQRIASRHGHLSNDQAAELISHLAHPRLQHVMLGHLSDDCNRPDTARQCIQHALLAGGAARARVWCAERRRVSPTLEVAFPPDSPQPPAQPEKRAVARPLAEPQQLGLF
ncbi:MAG: MBL fold metallo-hydrolase [Verrucomicrobiales bacterium]|nr:MBL fold metallo-hydrolase [Verrucomicrobiales bacterium]